MKRKRKPIDESILPTNLPPDDPDAEFTWMQISIIRAQFRHRPCAKEITRLTDAFMTSRETIKDILAERTWKLPKQGHV